MRASQIHQANGALQLLDLRGVALVTEAIEHLTRRFETRSEGMRARAGSHD